MCAGRCQAWTPQNPQYIKREKSPPKNQPPFLFFKSKVKKRNALQTRQSVVDRRPARNRVQASLGRVPQAVWLRPRRPLVPRHRKRQKLRFRQGQKRPPQSVVHLGPRKRPQVLRTHPEDLRRQPGQSKLLGRNLRRQGQGSLQGSVLAFGQIQAGRVAPGVFLDAQKRLARQRAPQVCQSQKVQNKPDHRHGGQVSRVESQGVPRGQVGDGRRLGDLREQEAPGDHQGV